jgi:hypothetical protein
MMLIEHINKLKILTTTRQADFGEVFDYFLKNIGNNHENLDQFECVFNHDILKPSLEKLGKTIYGDSAQMNDFLPFFYYASLQFVHGMVSFSNSCFLGFYFFEDVLSGIACNVFSPRRGETDFYRLELFVVDKIAADAIVCEAINPQGIVGNG